MTEAAVSAGTKTPIWFWIVAGTAVLWNGYGVFDYIGTQMSPGDLDSFSEEHRAYFTSLPTMFVALSACAVHLAFLSSLLLILRRKWAEPGLLISTGLYVISAIWSYGFMGAFDVIGGAGVLMSVLIFNFWVYARWARNKGLLR